MIEDLSRADQFNRNLIGILARPDSAIPTPNPLVSTRKPVTWQIDLLKNLNCT
jgi:hypothetical protein